MMIRFTICLSLFTLTSCRYSINFYEVEKGKLYRSAQLTEEELRTILPMGIKTVINLRGADEKAKWYQDEKKVTNELGLKLIDISMSSIKLPTRGNLIKLLDAFQTAERPILVHCKQGADRTGEAVAIYQMEYMGYSKDEAAKALDPKYWHIELFTAAKDYFIKDIYQGETWARSSYYPCGSDYKYLDDRSCESDDSQLIKTNIIENDL